MVQDFILSCAKKMLFMQLIHQQTIVAQIDLLSHFSELITVGLFELFHHKLIKSKSNA